jgi:16S rRNA (uracil1498-N3)-methyltransferase
MAKRRQHPADTRRRQQADSNTYRFFVAPGTLQGQIAQIDDPALIHQLSSVLRLSQGDQITLLDNSGWEYVVTLDAVERGSISGTIERTTLVQTEPQLKLTLYVALLRGERFEWVLQKGTELGVTAFVPVVCQRSVIDDIAEIGAAKIERWERIIREAAEQSRRAKLPELLPAMHFDTACDHAAQRSQSVVLWEGSGAVSLRSLLQQNKPQSSEDAAPFSIGLLSGPEGGFTEHEITTAVMHQLQPASLGPRILRAETAPVAAAAAVLFLHGDLD